MTEKVIGQNLGLMGGDVVDNNGSYSLISCEASSAVSCLLRKNTMCGAVVEGAKLEGHQLHCGKPLKVVSEIQKRINS